jgi:hypothetical protein
MIQKSLQDVQVLCQVAWADVSQIKSDTDAPAALAILLARLATAEFLLDEIKRGMLLSGMPSFEPEAVPQADGSGAENDPLRSDWVPIPMVFRQGHWELLK